MKSVSSPQVFLKQLGALLPSLVTTFSCLCINECLQEQVGGCGIN